MAAELHLAEDALALHLFLERLEGLVDVVVTDENLHAAFPFRSSGLNFQVRWRGQGPRSTVTGARNYQKGRRKSTGTLF